MTLRLSLGSQPYVEVPFDEAPQGFESFQVEISIVGVDQFHAAEDDWYEAQWESGVDPPTARVLIGGDGIPPLAAGSYLVRAQVTSDPETVILDSGDLDVI